MIKATEFVFWVSKPANTPLMEADSREPSARRMRLRAEPLAMAERLVAINRAPTKKSPSPVNTGVTTLIEWLSPGADDGEKRMPVQSVARLISVHANAREKRSFNDRYNRPSGNRASRRCVRQQQASPKLAALRPWLEAQMRGLPSDSALAKTSRYALNRWAAMIR
jgi:hypothetical protein